MKNKMNSGKNVIPVIAMFVAFGLFGAAMVTANGFGWMGGMSEEEHAAVQEAVQNGDYEAWRNLMESQITEERFNEMQTRHAEMQAHMEAMDAAFESGDYEAWKEAVAEDGREARMAEFVTEENFPLFAEMHEAMQSGDFDRVQEIRTELGLLEGGCMMHGEGKGFGMRGGMGPRENF